MITGSAREVLGDLTRLLRPRCDAQTAAVMALGEAKRHGKTRIDNDDLGKFTLVEIIYDDGIFNLVTITEHHDTGG